MAARPAWRPSILPNLVFRQLFDAASSTYTYLLGDPRTRQAVFIDTVFEQHPRDFALLSELDLQLVAVLDTHCHADHVTGAWLMKQATGCRIGISRRYQPPIQGADLPLDHGDRVTFGGRHLEVRATPGHTDGCLTLVLDDEGMAFTGDALLIRSTGRWVDSSARDSVGVPRTRAGAATSRAPCWRNSRRLEHRVRR